MCEKCIDQEYSLLMRQFVVLYWEEIITKILPVCRLCIQYPPSKKIYTLRYQKLITLPPSLPPFLPPSLPSVLFLVACLCR